MMEAPVFCMLTAAYGLVGVGVGVASTEHTPFAEIQQCQLSRQTV
jgi:hypothetical protein